MSVDGLRRVRITIDNDGNIVRIKTLSDYRLWFAAVAGLVVGGTLAYLLV